MNRHEPIISFVVPIYNVEKYLDKCVNSITHQTVTDIEIILVNDGSTDSSLAICQRLAGTDSRIRVLTQENCGLGATRNNGLQVASGKYISFIDPDDWIDTEMGAKLVAALDSSTADFASFRIAYVTENNVTTHVLPPFLQQELCAEEILNHALIDNQIYTSSCNKVYRHSFFKDKGITFPALRAYEDIYFTRVMSAQAEKCIFINEVLYFALIRAGSISRTITVGTLDLAVQVLGMERASLKIESRNSKQQDIFDAHVVKLLCYLIFLAAFRLGSWQVFSKCISVAERVGYEAKRQEDQILLHLSRKNKIMAKLSGMPRLLWCIARVLRHTRFSPY
jgi:glycosyltransferase EpsH